MIRIPFVDGWTVGPKLGAFESATEGAGPRPVTLPHDAIRDLERSADSPQGVHAGYYPGGVFEYAKSFDVPEEWRDRTVALEFEGVYRDAVVFVNGDFAAHEPNGYAGFTVGLDPFLQFGRPTGSRSRRARTRTAAGIRAPASIVPCTWWSPTRCTFALDGVRVTTPDIDDERAIVAVATTVRNDSRHTRTARVALDDARTRRCARSRHPPPDHGAARRVAPSHAPGSR